MFNRTQIINAIRSMINYWQNEGDTGSFVELRRDSFLHLRWLMDRGYTLDEAVQRMTIH